MQDKVELVRKLIFAADVRHLTVNRALYELISGRDLPQDKACKQAQLIIDVCHAFEINPTDFLNYNDIQFKDVVEWMKSIGVPNAHEFTLSSWHGYLGGNQLDQQAQTINEKLVEAGLPAEPRLAETSKVTPDVIAGFVAAGQALLSKSSPYSFRSFFVAFQLETVGYLS